MMATEDTSFKIEKLTAENYHSWKFNMKMYLIGKDLWEIVTGDEIILDDMSEAVKREIKKRENKAFAAICLGISTSLQIYVRSTKTAKEAWENLEKHFQQKTLSKKIFYRRKLYSAKMDKGQNMTEHINYIKTLSEHLEAIGDPIEEKDLVILLISSLPDDYNYLITALETIAEDNLTWDYVRDRLIHESEKKKPAEAENSADAFFTSKPPNNKKSGKCHYCKKPGHFARDCFKKKNDQKNESANLVNDDHNADELALKSSVTDINGDEWWIDSGATSHMTSDMKSLKNYSSFRMPRKVKLADEHKVNSFGKGNIHLTLFDKKNNEKVKTVLRDVLYVPKIKNKLFSISRVTDNGIDVLFKGENCNITKDGKQYTIGQKHGNLYKLNTIKPNDETCYIGKTNQDSIELWHQRYGHLGYDNLKLLNDKEMVDGLNIDTKEAVDRNCEGCAMGKQHRQPFPTKSQSTATKLLELIHSDVCGPMDVPSVGGSRYFVTFIDDFSRYTTVYMMKQKSEVLEKFRRFVNLVENRTGLKVERLHVENETVKRLRSDNGGEYFSNDFEEFCNGRGIQREPTIPYSPQQNGVAERMNRTLLETARSMLHHAKKPLDLWAEAVSTASYTRNRSPTAALKGVTPYELWYGKKPDVSILKVFGCKTYVHVPDEKRKGKLQRKSIPCIFVGYPFNENGYKLYNPETRKMLRSRDVIFVENAFDIEKSDDASHKFFTGTFEEENEVEEPENINEPQVAVDEDARPQRARRPPDRLNVLTGDWWNLMEAASVAAVDTEEPKTIEEALNGMNSKLWSDALSDEFNSLKENQTWDLVDLPAGKNIVGSKWVLKHKRGAEGEITRCKARLVAQGYSQKPGVDYDEVFSPVAKYSSIRTVLAIANQLDLDLHQMDVKTAFLNGDLEEEIFVRQPEGFIDKEHPSKVCRLRKSLYGLKQSARCWNKTIDEYLKQSGYVQNDADPCIYLKRFVKEGKEVILLIAVYVDDLLIASNNDKELISEKKQISKRFKMGDEGEVHYILGMAINRNRKDGVLTIDQHVFFSSMLKRFGMGDYKPVSTPLEPNTKFEKLKDDEEPVNLKEYQSVIGCLTYASIGTRPDLSAAVGVNICNTCQNLASNIGLVSNEFFDTLKVPSIMG